MLSYANMWMNNDVEEDRGCGLLDALQEAHKVGDVMQRKMVNNDPIRARKDIDGNGDVDLFVKLFPRVKNCLDAQMINLISSIISILITQLSFISVLEMKLLLHFYF